MHFGTDFLDYETSCSEIIIFGIGDIRTFLSLYYYFKDNLDNFKNYESA